MRCFNDESCYVWLTGVPSRLLTENNFFSLGGYEIERKNLILEICIIALNPW